MQAIIMFFLDVLTLSMINPLLFNTLYEQHETYYVNELTNKSYVKDFTNITEHGRTSELYCIDPGGPPCCIPPLTIDPQTGQPYRECLEKNKQ
jgi:hypothetical protein